MASNALSSPPLLTATDYKELTPPYELGPRYELIEGELVLMSSLNRYHQDISRNLVFQFESYLRQNLVGIVYDAPFDVYLDDTNVFQPDVLFVSTARAPEILRPEGAVGAPDLVIEILSPSTARIDKQRKRPILARLGAQEMWLVDPLLRQVQVYRFATDVNRPAAIYEESDTLETPLLPGLMLSLREVFAQRFV